jgi:hypothetical protein
VSFGIFKRLVGNGSNPGLVPIHNVDLLGSIRSNDGQLMMGNWIKILPLQDNGSFLTMDDFILNVILNKSSSQVGLTNPFISLNIVILVKKRDLPIYLIFNLFNLIFLHLFKNFFFAG